MLPRVLEPEVMDTPEEAADYDAMDHAQVNRAFVSDFSAVWDGRGPVLDVGTGTAQIPIELCRQHPAARVVAVDLAESMLVLARRNVERAGFADRIEVRKENGRSLSFADGAFPAVMSNSIVHHIPEPFDCLKDIWRVLAPGGTLFVRDLMRPADRARLDRLVATYAGDANAHQQQMFAESLHAALTRDEMRSLVARLGGDPADVQATSDRHWTWVAKK
jgi:ubiquinone/menaquinone biosynthesis C-methylase UbiE